MQFTYYISYLLILIFMAYTTEGICNYIRLRGGRLHAGGLVEVKVEGNWGQICSDTWSLKEAEVTCRQFGFSGARDISPLVVSSNTVSVFLLSEVRCNGTEWSIFNCKIRTDQTNNYCRSNSPAKVTCILPIKRPPEDNSPCLRNQFLCKNKNMCMPQLWKCDGRNQCGDNEDEDGCVPQNRFPYEAMSIRLAGKNVPNDGHLEVRYGGVWGSVCDDGFRMTTEGHVVCRQLGYPGVARVYRNNTDVRRGLIIMDKVRCIGNESSIFDCRGNQFGVNDCVHTEDVWITCQLSAPVTVSQTVRGCGIQRFPILETSHRIVGGQPVAKGSWPWQASLLLTFPSGVKQPFCGGALIDSQWVLTAAHCFDNINISTSVHVRLGEHDMHIHEGTEQEFTILNIVKSPLYQPGKHLLDIALVKLSRPANIASNYVQDICLPENNARFNESDYCYTIGWGNTRGTGNKNVLQQIRIPVYSYNECRKIYSTKFVPGMICAGYENGAKDACQGDSGGPLMCKRDNRWIVAGVISWGEGCGEMNKPGVYTEVAPYVRWIENTMHPSTTPSLYDVFGR